MEMARQHIAALGRGFLAARDSYTPVKSRCSAITRSNRRSSQRSSVKCACLGGSIVVTVPALTAIDIAPPARLAAAISKRVQYQHGSGRGARRDLRLRDTGGRSLSTLSI